MCGLLIFVLSHRNTTKCINSPVLSVDAGAVPSGDTYLI